MLASQCEWDLKGVGEVMNGEMSHGGFHPMFAKDTPNGVRIRLDTDGAKCMGTIVTKWDGSGLNTPIVLHSDPVCDTVEAAVMGVVDRWCKIIGDIKNSGSDHDVVVDALIATKKRKAREDTFPLTPGDYVAYLIPDIPACHQTQFIITRVVSVQPFVLANNHHTSLFSGGRGELARYNPSTKRVVFPVKNLRDLV
jgi:hypothetical protein